MRFSPSGVLQGEAFTLTTGPDSWPQAIGDRKINLSDARSNPEAGRDREEEALARGLAAGDPTHIEGFLRRTHRPVYAMASRLTRDPDQRHDWSQDVLLKVLGEMADGRFVYRRPGCFWAWFRLRANYLLINRYHQHKKHRERWSTGEVGAAIVDKVPLTQGADPLHLLETVEARRVVEECLGELTSAEHRQALHLVMFQEQAYQEVAEAMGATLNTVRSWIRRARIAMRQCVAGKFEYHETENL